SYVFGSLLVFWRSGQMRRRRERPQMLLRQLGIGDRQKLLLRLLLAAEIAIAKDGWGGGRRGDVGALRWKLRRDGKCKNGSRKSSSIQSHAGSKDKPKSLHHLSAVSSQWSVVSSQEPVFKPPEPLTSAERTAEAIADCEPAAGIF